MDIPPKLYHVTSAARWPEIQKLGLLPCAQRPKGKPLWPYEGHHPNPDNVIFFDPDIIVAFNHSAEAYDHPVVLEVDATGLDVARFRINSEWIEHLMEDEMFMYNHHDQHLGPVVKADPAYETVASDGHGGHVFLQQASDETNRRLVELAIEHGYSLAYEGSVGPERLRVATEAEMHVAYKEWEAAHSEYASTPSDGDRL